MGKRRVASTDVTKGTNKASVQAWYSSKDGYPVLVTTQIGRFRQTITEILTWAGGAEMPPAERVLQDVHALLPAAATALQPFSKRRAAHDLPRVTPRLQLYRIYVHRVCERIGGVDAVKCI
jgi:hypothetical protein